MRNQFIILCCLLLVAQQVWAQSITRTNFNYLIATTKGDLNKDGMADSVVVTQDTLQDTSPHKIEVYLQVAPNKYKFLTSSTQLVPAQYPNGKDGYIFGHAFGYIKIEKGILLVNTELLRGHTVHKFRYQNNGMELIGYSSASASGHGTYSSVDFNLSTGNRVEEEISMETDNVISHDQFKKMIRPLPRLEEVEFSGSEWY